MLRKLSILKVGVTRVTWVTKKLSGQRGEVVSSIVKSEKPLQSGFEAAFDVLLPPITLHVTHVTPHLQIRYFRRNPDLRHPRHPRQPFHLDHPRSVRRATPTSRGGGVNPFGRARPWRPWPRITAQRTRPTFTTQCSRSIKRGTSARRDDGMNQPLGWLRSAGNWARTFVRPRGSSTRSSPPAHGRRRQPRRRPCAVFPTS